MYLFLHGLITSCNLPKDKVNLTFMFLWGQNTHTFEERKPCSFWLFFDLMKRKQVQLFPFYFILFLLFLYYGLLKNILFLFIYLFLEIGERREKERGRNINAWLPLMWPPLGTWPATQACALTGNRTGDPLVCSLHSTHWATPARAQR